MSAKREVFGSFLILVAEASSIAAAPPVFFERHVQPILLERCSECHQGGDAESGLDVSNRDRLLAGGESGPALVPGSGKRSLLLDRIAAGEMPPEGTPLTDEQVDLIRRWIDDGAPLEGEHALTEQGSAGAPAEAEVLSRLFFTHCISCHGKWKQEGGLDLRTANAMKRGGKSGPALIAGNAAASLVYKRLLADEMPPRTSVLGESNYVRRVSPDEIELLRQWIDAGAPSDELEGIDRMPIALAARRGTTNFWSFMPLRHPAAPQVSDASSVRSPIDAFVIDRLASLRLTLSPPADKLALMRRAYFDLTGLPPSPEEVVAYIADDRADAYEQLIDRLLDSPRYGERWAQHWLDAAGYADSHGKIDRDQFRPYMWRYRDYVIRSLNADKPYDQFLTEQIAGDELVAMEGQSLAASEQIERLIATGFLLTAADATDEAAFNFVTHRMGVLAEQIDIFSTAVMGLTMECARCHNHKFDPISQNDYYRLSALFQTALDPYDWRIVSQVYYPSKQPLDRFYQRYIYHPADSEPQELARFNRPLRAQLNELKTKLKAAVDQAHQRLKTQGEPNAERLKPDELASKLPEFKRDLETLQAEINSLQARIIEPRVIHGMRDLGGEPTPVFQLRRGDPMAPGVRVHPGVPRFLEEATGPFQAVVPTPSTGTSGNRLALARWLTQPHHPLTARVIVNRVWQHHFGTGLVSTSGNFGEKGSRPTHPELLDWLAAELVNSNWSLKTLHRLIMSSAVYRQSSQPGAGQLAADPDNVYWSRFPFRRLEGEAIRDALLAVSGRLDLATFGPPESITRSADGEVYPETSGKQRRSIYLAKMRMRPATLIEQFDGAEMTPNCLERTYSTTATQALQLYNSSFVRECAASLAERVLSGHSALQDRVRHTYLIAFARPPSSDELRHDSDHLKKLCDAWRDDDQPEKAGDDERLAWESYCHAILNSPEFIYVD